MCHPTGLAAMLARAISPEVLFLGEIKSCVQAWFRMLMKQES